MHAIKGGWVGQTFAMTRCNDSDPVRGKKSRTRRSKEERKGMVESFIKKYQESNNGNFPSLNLTHKEVGGSFYTVREIVREVIQENRVLGPAKTDLLLQKNDQFLEQNPLGSIAVEPPKIILNEIVQETTHQPFMDVSGGNLNGEELLVNGHVVEFVKDSVEGSYLESGRVEESVEIASGLDHSATITSTVINLTDVEVETLPVTTVAHIASEMVAMDGISPEKLSLTGSFDGGLSPEPNLPEDQSSIDCEVRAVSGLAGSSVEKTPVSKDTEALEVVVEESSATSVEVSEVKCITIDSKDGSHVSHDCSGSRDFLTTETKQDLDTTNLGARDAQMGVHAGRNDGNNAIVEGEKSLQGEKMKPGHGILSNSKDSDSRAENTPTLDRINLSESWKVVSKNSPTTNPMLAILKSFVVSFIKFWTE